MKPKGPLMKEHRLIEKMIGRISSELQAIRKDDTTDPLFIDTAVDFIRTYADRTHHGKEEDILFTVLREKQMSEEDTRIMNELIQEHVYGRQTTGKLVAANTRYRTGDSGALRDIREHLQALVDFYPKHIEKEDAIFFPHSETYLSEEEREKMLGDFFEFDKQMIHEKYGAVVKAAQGKS